MLLKQSYRGSNSDSFFFTENILIFDWIQIVAETQWSQFTKLDKSPFNFEYNITKNEHSALFFLIYVSAVFMKTKLYYGSYEV